MPNESKVSDDELDARVQQHTRSLLLANDQLKAEIAAHQRAEALLDGERHVLEMMATGASLADILTALVQFVESQSPGMLGSILLLDPDGIHVRHGAAPSLPPAYVEAIDGQCIGPHAGSCGTAAYTREPVIVGDIATDPRWAESRDAALPHGLRACWSTPVFGPQREVLGSFAMYYRHPALPEADHERLIEMTTHIASLAICCHRTRTQLEKSEADLKEAQSLAKIGYWNRDVVADRITWSEEMWRIAGLEPQNRTLNQAELQTMIHPDDREIQRRALEATLECNRPYDVEFRIVRPDHEVRYVHARDAIEYDSAHHPIRIFGTLQDITDRKHSEDAVRESKHLLDLVLTTLPVGVTVTDRVGDIVLVNAASKRLWGDSIVEGHVRWARSEGYWHDSGRRIEPGDWASVRALTEGKTSLNELIDIVTFDGQKKVMRNSTVPIRNGGGIIVGCVIVNEDVTERVRAEEELQARQKEIRAIVEHTPDSIVRYDLDLRRIYVNPAFIKSMGKPAEELLGREVGDGTADELSEELTAMKAAIQRVRDTRRPVDAELAWVSAAPPRIFIVHFEPEFDARGVFTSILMIARDVTELKEGDERFRQMERELAQVSKLTTMGELAVTIAHEINQPLAALITNAEAALNWLGAAPPQLGEVRDAILHILSDGNRAAEVIARIRALIRNGEGVRTPLDVNDLMEKTLALAQPELARHKISIRVELDNELPQVEADRVQIQQVLLNLLTNAKDSLDTVTDRPRMLRIFSRRKDAVALVCVGVQDFGAGVELADIENMFQAFFTTKPHGLGMGLAISRSIVEAHGGRLWATPNEPGEGPGVTFQFTLPLQEGSAT